MNRSRTKTFSFLTAGVAVLLALSGCASVSMSAEELGRAFEGSKAAFRTYDKAGDVMDDVTGTSIRVTRDSTFDDFNGDSTTKGSVVLVQVGQKLIRHVGSTATLVEDGIKVIVPARQGQAIKSTENAAPFIQKILAGQENVWKGSAKTVLVRTQDDVPVAVFSGNEVELFKPDIPNATAIRVVGTDGKARYALIYRANLTIYDTALIAPAQS
ncbi:DUF5052 family protein [Arthrobacter bambusae]|uniref:DUF5052 domain-containing protein n=1 Tax=Arthrobacter bambusae TaxID=1338426 RepID=A0AAW8DB45_9MICC|nr:DUF5052 family protein [Arthrobacter bambusae]MDP9903156.1 hypothetical protein [Arthrobacter bambusae]MDQ0128850.1 hypothetical protein [Arthrobacter bambusae]MDQ0180191.1 hypothetical protein [Arthrobacter bambusae]